MTDPISVLKRESATQLSDRPGHRIYFVRIDVPASKRIIATAVELSEAHIDSDHVKALIERDGTDRETAFKLSAVDSVRIRFEEIGFTREQLDEARVVECRRVNSRELERLIVEYARKEGD